MKPVLFLLAVSFLTLMILRGSAQNPSVEPVVVMSPRMRITAPTQTGTIAITAGAGYTRAYTCEGATRSVDMDPRQVRWYGSLGLYFPGPGEHWTMHNGITRGVLEKGQ